MPRRLSVIGAVVGAVLGGVGRGALAAFHLQQTNRETFVAILVVAAIGVVIGGLAGMMGRPLLGAVVGVVLSGVVYLATLPVALLMQALDVGRTASLGEVLGVGAVVGAVAGAAERLLGRATS